MERDFKGIWIPKEIWLDDRLTPLEKIILAEIDSLDNEENGGCSAGNDYLADFCKCSANKVALAVSKLKELGFIELVSFDGRIRILKSRLKETIRQTLKISKADSKKEKGIKIDNNIDNKIKKVRYDEVLDRRGIEGKKREVVFEYIKMRKLIKKPLTNLALDLALDKLDKMASTEDEQIAILEQSIQNSWQGLFPLKDKKGCHVAHKAEEYNAGFNEDGTFKW